MKSITPLVFWFLLLATSLVDASSERRSAYAGGGAGAAAGEASGLVASLEEPSLREGQSWRRSDLAIDTAFAEQKELCPECCHESYRPPKPCSFCNDNERNTLGPLTRAVKTGCQKNVSEALDAGGRTNERGEDGRTPLHYAAQKGFIHLFPILFRAGASINETDNQGATALHHAEAHGQDKSVLMLLNLAVDASIETIELKLTKKNTTATRLLCEAVRNRSLARVARLLSQGADPNACDDHRGEIPLILAQYHNTLDGVRIITMLVGAGADPNGLDKFGQSALHYAAYHGRHRCAVALISAGANPNAQITCSENSGNTALHCAAFNGHYKIVKALLDAGADTTICNARKMSAIDYARAKGHTEITELLESWDPPMAWAYRPSAKPLVKRGAVAVPVAGDGCGCGCRCQ